MELWKAWPRIRPADHPDRHTGRVCFGQGHATGCPTRARQTVRRPGCCLARARRLRPDPYCRMRPELRPREPFGACHGLPYLLYWRHRERRQQRDTLAAQAYTVRCTSQRMEGGTIRRSPDSRAPRLRGLFCCCRGRRIPAACTSVPGRRAGRYRAMPGGVCQFWRCAGAVCRPVCGCCAVSRGRAVPAQKSACPAAVRGNQAAFRSASTPDEASLRASRVHSTSTWPLRLSPVTARRSSVKPRR